jgi:hypothetical protein
MFAHIVAMQLKPKTRQEFTQTFENQIVPILRKQQGFTGSILDPVMLWRQGGLLKTGKSASNIATGPAEGLRLLPTSSARRGGKSCARSLNESVSALKEALSALNAELSARYLGDKIRRSLGAGFRGQQSLIQATDSVLDSGLASILIFGRRRIIFQQLFRYFRQILLLLLWLRFRINCLAGDSSPD